MAAVYSYLLMYVGKLALVAFCVVTVAVDLCVYNGVVLVNICAAGVCGGR